MTVYPEEIARLKRLPLRRDLSWQGGILELPLAELFPDSPEVDDEVGIVVFGCAEDEVIGPPFEPRLAEDIAFEEALAALAELAETHPRAGYRPGRLEVCDPALAGYLQPLLAAAEIEVQVVPGEVAELPALAPFLQHLQELEVAPGRHDEDLDPGLPLAGAPGLERERITAFAHAADLFRRAEPWRRLADCDLVRVTAPPAPPGLDRVVVCGRWEGFEGLRFHTSYDQFRAWQHEDDELEDLIEEGPLWLLSFESLFALPEADRELWSDDDLPPYDKVGCPHLTVTEDGEARHVRPEELSFVEGLLRALAQSTEEELDSGRWRRGVATCDGRMEYALELPDLLEPPSRAEMSRRGWEPDERANERLQLILSRRLEEVEPDGDIESAIAAVQAELQGRDFMEAPFAPADDRERAQDLCYHAYDSFGRRRIALARQALALMPGCADARVILAEETVDPRESLALLEPAVAAGLAHVDSRTLEDCAGDLWPVVRARGYLRALQQSMFELRALGRMDEAIARCEELARLDAADHVGVWRAHVSALADERRDEELLEVAGRAPEGDPSDRAFAAWMRALAAYRIHGDGPEALAALREARQRNRYVAEELTVEALRRKLAAPGLARGRRGEAQILAAALRRFWSQTPGAVAWAGSARTVGGKQGKGRPARPGRKGRG